MSVELINIGCIITSIMVPDRSGKMGNVVAGFENWEQYLDPHPYFGCIVGRFANRIANGIFNLEGKRFQLSVNDPPNHLHGGVKGFDKKIWQVKEVIEKNDCVGVSLSYISIDGEEGYPGTLETTVTYLLETDNKLYIECTATTDKTTIINLTNHSYFNLTAFETATIYKHHLQIAAKNILAKSDQQTPTGKRIDIINSSFDFTKDKEIGEYISSIPGELGYDHSYVLDEHETETMPVAILSDPASGRQLSVFTNQPSIHCYTANWWDGTLLGSQGKNYLRHGAIALEAQAFPDAPNHPQFPTTILRPDEVYRAYTVYQFGLTKQA